MINKNSICWKCKNLAELFGNEDDDYMHCNSKNKFVEHYCIYNLVNRLIGGAIVKKCSHYKKSRGK